MTKIHTFHIPVMGTGFSIDTPVKVARYGISSVVSLVDDTLIEEMRKFYTERLGESFEPISKYEDDHRAKRITAYLDLMDRMVKDQFNKLRASSFAAGTEITKYFEMLPLHSPLKKLYLQMLETVNPAKKKEIQDELRASIQPGEINVNIMTKVDPPNFSAKNKEPLPPEFSDALAALRGYAKSTLDSCIVFSAGINQRLYSYIENFKDFYADASGHIKKRIILKVSDYRSSLIQGKFLAKKGLWVSEYRVESGLNCGGHAFATTGDLMGPILEEFKNRRHELIESLHKMYNQALQLKNKPVADIPHKVEITAQGGIGTAKEDKFLRDYYELDATGWGTPFLLCPEATNVEDETLEKLANAGEEDLYLSDISPLGVPFNNLRDSASDLQKERKSQAGKPGSACPKGHLVSNTEFTKLPICTASRLYQKMKLEQLKKELDETQYARAYKKIVQKACICHDLGEGVLIKNKIPKKIERFSAICPGPNMAYFSKIVSLPEMVGHIYGRLSILNQTYRPHMFIKELKLYVDYLKREVEKTADSLSERDAKYFREFKNNLLNGIEYYRELLPKIAGDAKKYYQKFSAELDEQKKRLDDFVDEYIGVFNLESAGV